MSSNHIRAAHSMAEKRAPDASCSTGGMYTSPAAGSTVNTTVPLTITWNPTCITPANDKIDIYLYAPTEANSRVHVWQNVPFKVGKYSTDLKPKWWKSTSSVQLQLAIVEANTPAFMAALPAGPVFTATYTPPADGSTPVDADVNKPESGVTNVAALGGSHLPGGKVAAAVIMPLLVIIAAGVLYYLKMSRAKGVEKRKRFSEMVDKRMSTISTDWKSVTPGGAREAIRQSMAGPGGNRMSGFAFGQIRPQSTWSDNGAGMGARGGYQQEDNYSPDLNPSFSQLRPGFRGSAYATQDRVSRVSFANDPRPRSGKWDRSIYEEEPVPPVPQISSDQATGPLTLTPEDIQARLHGKDNEKRSSVDEVMPALSMMRTGGEGSDHQGNDDYLLWEAPATPMTPAPGFSQHQHAPQPPIPAPTHDRSPVGLMPMQAMPANMMSPDEMLRAYATRSAQGSRDGTNSPNYPLPTANGTSFQGGGMRTLYSPAGPAGANVMGGVGLGGRRPGVGQGMRGSGMFDEEDAYDVGTAK